MALNTHSYDRLWASQYHQLKGPFLPCYSFSKVLQEIETRFLDPAVNQVINLLKQGGNYDQSNQVDFEELLPIVWILLYNHPGLEEIFLEQLKDILNGSCPEGRCTRIFQVFLCLVTSQ